MTDLEYLEQAEAHADEGPLGEPAARSILKIALKLARQPQSPSTSPIGQRLCELHSRLSLCWENGTGEQPPRRPHVFEPKWEDLDTLLDAAMVISKPSTSLSDVLELWREMIRSGPLVGGQHVVVTVEATNRLHAAIKSAMKSKEQSK